jgi:hypothetical protein
MLWSGGYGADMSKNRLVLIAVLVVLLGVLARKVKDV